MIKNTLLILFLLVGTSAFAQFTLTIQWQPIKPSNTGDTIYYKPDQKLTWPDFQGRPDASSRAAAITQSGFGYKLAMNGYNNKTDVVITVDCYFSKKNSWVKKEGYNDYALLHEQHHFDITYINACLFVKKLRAANFNRKNFNILAQQIHDEYFNAMSKMQDDYDGQTLNGRIKPKQAEWNKKIDVMLAELATN